MTDYSHYTTKELVILVICNLAVIAYMIYLLCHNVIPSVNAHDWSQATFWMVVILMVSKLAGGK